MTRFLWFLVCCTLVSVAEAGPGAQGLQRLQKKDSPLLKALTGGAKKNAIATCTDFSGNWKGTCVADTFSYQNDFTIEQQECSSIAFETNRVGGWMKVMDDKLLFIGATTTSIVSTGANLGGHITVNELMSWEPGNKKLWEIHTMHYVEQMVDPSTGEEFHLPFAYKTETSFEINKNGKLIEETTGDVTVSCKYSKY